MRNDPDSLANPSVELPEPAHEPSSRLTGGAGRTVSRALSGAGPHAIADASTNRSALLIQNLYEYWNFADSLVSWTRKRRLRFSSSSCIQPWLNAMNRSFPGRCVQRMRLCHPRFLERLSYWTRFENDSRGETV